MLVWKYCVCAYVELYVRWDDFMWLYEVRPQIWFEDR